MELGLNKAKVITVTSCKGGTGKTTTVLNLAGIYASNNKKVLIIDMDFYSSAISVMLNLNPINDVYTFADDINNNRYNELSDYITKYNNMIDVIAGPKDIRMSSKISSSYVPMILAKVNLKYDVILIDTNHFMNDVNLTILENSDSILYVITEDPVDLKNMRSMISIYKDMERNNYSILLNESIFKGRKTFTKNDVNKFLKRDVDFHISEKFNIKNIDKYISNGTILTLDKNIKLTYKRNISNFKYMADSLLLGKEE